MHDDILCCIECPFLLIARSDWIVYTRRVAAGHENRDLRRQFRQFKGAFDRVSGMSSDV